MDVQLKLFSLPHSFHYDWIPCISLCVPVTQASSSGSLPKAPSVCLIDCAPVMTNISPPVIVPNEKSSGKEEDSTGDFSFNRSSATHSHKCRRTQVSRTPVSHLANKIWGGGKERITLLHRWWKGWEMQSYFP